MRSRELLKELARRQSGLILLMGVSSILTGISRLLKPPLRQAQNPRVGAVSGTELPAESRRHYFSIRQTRSEVGFVYWVLQGFGWFESFSLHDTWQEAMTEANRRLAECAISVPAKAFEHELQRR